MDEDDRDLQDLLGVSEPFQSPVHSVQTVDTDEKMYLKMKQDQLNDELNLSLIPEEVPHERSEKKEKKGSTF